MTIRYRLIYSLLKEHVGCIVMKRGFFHAVIKEVIQVTHTAHFVMVFFKVFKTVGFMYINIKRNKTL